MFFYIWIQKSVCAFECKWQQVSIIFIMASPLAYNKTLQLFPSLLAHIGNIEFWWVDSKTISSNHNQEAFC